MAKLLCLFNSKLMIIYVNSIIHKNKGCYIIYLLVNEYVEIHCYKTFINVDNFMYIISFTCIHKGSM